MDSGSLQITDVRTSDSAMYQCFATNNAGEVNAATWLKILSMCALIVKLFFMIFNLFLSSFLPYL